jgi:hypothetical protein
MSKKLNGWLSDTFKVIGDTWNGTVGEYRKQGLTALYSHDRNVRSEKQYADKARAARLGEHVCEVNRFLEALKIGRVDGQFRGISGNLRDNLIETGFERTETIEVPTKDGKGTKKQKQTSQIRIPDDCGMQILFLGDLTESQWTKYVTDHGTHVGLDRIGKFRSVKMHWIAGHSETEIRRILGWSKGGVQDHYRVCRLSNVLPGIEAAWVNGEINQQDVTDLYKAYNDAATDNDTLPVLLEARISNEEPKVKRPKAKAVREMMERFPKDFHPIFKWVNDVSYPLNAADYDGASIQFGAVAAEASE